MLPKLVPNISDAEARKEYFDSFIGGAVLGGTLAVPGRAFERSKIKTQAEQAEQRDKAEAKKVAAQAQEAERVAEEARKQDPVYMRQAVAESAALEQQKTALLAQIYKVPKGERLTEEQKQANNVIQAQLKELAPKLTEAAKESNRVKPLLARMDAEVARMAEEARVAGLSPEEFMAEQEARTQAPALGCCFVRSKHKRTSRYAVFYAAGSPRLRCVRHDRPCHGRRVGQNPHTHAGDEAKSCRNIFRWPRASA